MGGTGNLLLLALAFVLLGVVLIAVSLLCFNPKQRRNLTHRTTTGIVKGGEVVEREEGGQKVYAPVIHFEYEVGGVQYRVKGYDLANTTGSQEWAASIVGCYPREMEVTVYYDPNHPDHSAIDVAVESSPTICLGTFQTLGFVCLGLGVLLGLVVAVLSLTGHGGR